MGRNRLFKWVEFGLVVLLIGGAIVMAKNKKKFPKDFYALPSTVKESTLKDFVFFGTVTDIKASPLDKQ